MKIEILKRNLKPFTTVEIDGNKKVLDLKKVIKAQTKVSIPRQRLTIGAQPNIVVLDADSDKTLSEYGLKEGTQVIFKDLGPQIPFRPVYLIEYLGPLVIYPIFALRLCKFFYNKDAKDELNLAQRIAFILWNVHYIKRQLETIFVHEFGTLTMPVFNLFKNCSYYYTAALLVSWNVNIPANGDEAPEWRVYLGTAWFVISMLCNFICHLMLSRLRAKGRNTIVLPHGFLFEYVDAPNYFCEIMTWFGFNILTGFTLAGVAFNVVGMLQMIQWANKKHADYKRLFGDEYPKNRKILFPFIY